MLSNKSIQTFVCEEKPPNDTPNLCSSVNHYPSTKKQPPWHLVSHGKSPESQLRRLSRITVRIPWFFTGELLTGPDVFLMSLDGEYIYHVLSQQKPSKNLWLGYTLFYDREPFEKEWGKENATTNIELSCLSLKG